MAEPTKTELLEQAEGMGLEVDDSMTKAALQSLIESAEAQPTQPAEEEPQPAEEEPEPEPEPEGDAVCAVCGQPATRMTDASAAAYSVAYYCDSHGQNEPLKAIAS